MWIEYQLSTFVRRKSSDLVLAYIIFNHILVHMLAWKNVCAVRRKNIKIVLWGLEDYSFNQEPLNSVENEPIYLSLVCVPNLEERSNRNSFHFPNPNFDWFWRFHTFFLLLIFQIFLFWLSWTRKPIFY